MKMLNGRELSGFIQERQAHQVRALRQANGVQPKLAIIRTNPDPIVDSYMKLKQDYGADILVDVDVHTIDQSEALQRITAKVAQDLGVPLGLHALGNGLDAERMPHTDDRADQFALFC